MFSSLLLSCSSTIDSWKNRGAHRIGASISQHWASGTIRCFSTLCYSGCIEHGSLCQVQTKLHTRIPVWLKGIKWQMACRVPGECGGGVALWSRTIFFHILKKGARVTQGMGAGAAMVQHHILFVQRSALQVPRFPLKPLPQQMLGESPEAGRKMLVRVTLKLVVMDANLLSAVSGLPMR